MKIRHYIVFVKDETMLNGACMVQIKSVGQTDLVTGPWRVRYKTQLY